MYDDQDQEENDEEEIEEDEDQYNGQDEEGDYSGNPSTFPKGNFSYVIRLVGAFGRIQSVLSRFGKPNAAVHRTRWKRLDC